jgi:hypothetical protein
LEQYYVSWMGYPFWKWESKFDISEHTYVEDVEASEEDLFSCGMALLNTL